MNTKQLKLFLLIADLKSFSKAAELEAASAEIAAAAVRLGGTVSGEHGIGMEKRDLMALQFASDDLEAFGRIRDAFDPNGLLNPGKVLPEVEA